MRITLVKKLLADGTPCRKCQDVERRLKESNLLDKIDRIVLADENDLLSEGMQLAKKHNVELAPFFIVEHDNGETQVYTVYFKFLKEILEPGSQAVA